MKPKGLLTLRIDQDVLNKLKELSKDKNKTQSYLANEAIKEYVEKSLISPAAKLDTSTYTSNDFNESQCGYTISTLTEEEIENLKYKDKLNINDKQVSVLEFLNKCRKKTNIRELKILLKKNTPLELSKRLWR